MDWDDILSITSITILFLFILNKIIFRSNRSENFENSAESIESSASEFSFQDGIPPGISNRKQGEYEKAQVFTGFATNRKRENGIFTNNISNSLSYGFCEVSIPKHHNPGDLSRPTQRWYWFDQTEDEGKHIILQQIGLTTAQQFFKYLSISSPHSILIFIHGYNVDFKDAALRSAQLQYDLRFEGQSLFFSWASHGTLSGYVNDGERIANSVNDIRNFLENLANNDGINEIYLIGHSMGNRGLTEALSSIKDKLTAETNKKFKELILAEPDISQDIFRTKISDGLASLGARVTLYASENDKALGISQPVNNGVPRLGQAGSNIFVDREFDTVDASDVGVSLLHLNHSTYAENLLFIHEINDVLDGKDITRRSGVEEVKDKNYWYLFPQ